MAGLRYTQMNAAANNPTGHYPKEERQFYERKGLEHQQKGAHYSNMFNFIFGFFVTICVFSA